MCNYWALMPQACPWLTEVHGAGEVCVYVAKAWSPFGGPHGPQTHSAAAVTPPPTPSQSGPGTGSHTMNPQCRKGISFISLSPALMLKLGVETGAVDRLPTPGLMSLEGEL